MFTTERWVHGDFWYKLCWKTSRIKILILKKMLNTKVSDIPVSVLIF